MSLNSSSRPGLDTLRPAISLKTSDDLVQPWRQQPREISPLTRLMGAPSDDAPVYTPHGQSSHPDSVYSAVAPNAYRVPSDPQARSAWSTDPHDVSFNLSIFSGYETEDNESSGGFLHASNLPESVSNSPRDSLPGSSSSESDEAASFSPYSSKESSRTPSMIASDSDRPISTSTHASSESPEKDSPLFSPSTYMNPRTPPPPPPKDTVAHLRVNEPLQDEEPLSRVVSQAISISALLDTYGNVDEDEDDENHSSLWPPSPSSPLAAEPQTAPLSIVKQEQWTSLPPGTAPLSIKSSLAKSASVAAPPTIKEPLPMRKAPLPSPTSSSSSPETETARNIAANRFRDLLQIATGSAPPMRVPEIHHLEPKESPLPPLPPAADIVISSAPKRKDSMLRGIPRSPSGTIRRKGSAQASENSYDGSSLTPGERRPAKDTDVQDRQIESTVGSALQRNAHEGMDELPSDGGALKKSSSTSPTRKYAMSSPVRERPSAGLPPRPSARLRTVQWADEGATPKPTTEAPAFSAPPSALKSARDRPSVHPNPMRGLLSQMNLNGTLSPLSPLSTLPQDPQAMGGQVSPVVTSPLRRLQSQPFPSAPVRTLSIRKVGVRPLPKRKGSKIYHPDME